MSEVVKLKASSVELFAAHALQGLLANPSHTLSEPSLVIERATCFAIELAASLERAKLNSEIVELDIPVVCSAAEFRKEFNVPEIFVVPSDLKFWDNNTVIIGFDDDTLKFVLKLDVDVDFVDINFNSEITYLTYKLHLVKSDNEYLVREISDYGYRTFTNNVNLKDYEEGERIIFDGTLLKIEKDGFIFVEFPKDGSVGAVYFGGSEHFGLEEYLDKDVKITALVRNNGERLELETIQHSLVTKPEKTVEELTLTGKVVSLDDIRISIHANETGIIHYIRLKSPLSPSYEYLIGKEVEMVVEFDTIVPAGAIYPRKFLKTIRVLEDKNTLVIRDGETTIPRSYDGKRICFIGNVFAIRKRSINIELNDKMGTLIDLSIDGDIGDVKLTDDLQSIYAIVHYDNKNVWYTFDGIEPYHNPSESSIIAEAISLIESGKVEEVIGREEEEVFKNKREAMGDHKAAWAAFEHSFMKHNIPGAKVSDEASSRQIDSISQLITNYMFLKFP